MAICDRCRRETAAITGSIFNTQVICMTCSDAERAHPDFEAAQKAEAEAVKGGDLDFPGVGLPDDLRGGGW